MERLAKKLHSDGGLVLFGCAAAIFALISRFGDDGYAWLVMQCGSAKIAQFVLLGLWPCVVFLVYGLILFTVDIHPAFAGFRTKYKLQPGFKPDLATYAQAARVAAFNFLVLGLPWAALLIWFVTPWVDAQFGWQSDAAVPTTGQFLKQLVVILFCQDWFFYWAHRAAHHKRVYRHVHKMHHTFTAPFGIAAVYAHPVEHVIANMLPVSAGPILAGCHPMVTGLCWTTFALVNTMTSHSGYKIPGLNDPYKHDYHHLEFNANYGAIFLDRLLGTEGRFVADDKARREAESIAWVHRNDRKRPAAHNDGDDDAQSEQRQRQQEAEEVVSKTE
jgi:sterol desaturase/sphingolipid hydroxylase (fatty acid hydroxylase superfamily)